MSGRLEKNAEVLILNATIWRRKTANTGFDLTVGRIHANRLAIASRSSPNTVALKALARMSISIYPAGSC